MSRALREEAAESVVAGPDQRLVGRAFARAAAGYDAVAHLQRDVGDALLENLPRLELSPVRLLDVGAGTGYCTRKLLQRYPRARLTALDLAHGMLLQCRAGSGEGRSFSLVCGEAESLPLRGTCMDLVVSNLALQWCRELPVALAEFRRVLRPGGVQAFSTFGPATLQELREAWARVDGHSHVLEFPAARQVAAALAVAGFREVSVQSRVRVVTYSSVEALMRELKGLGASNRSPRRPRHLVGKRAMGAMIEAYEERSKGGRIPASFEIIHAYARRV